MGGERGGRGRVGGEEEREVERIEGGGEGIEGERGDSDR